MLRDTTDLFDDLRRVACVVPLHNLQDTAWMLHGFITFDLAGMSMSEQALSVLTVGHNVLLIVKISRPFVRMSNPARWLLCWLSCLSLFRQLVLPAPAIVGIVVGFQAREDALKVLCILEIITHDKRRIRICLYILLEVEIVLENVIDDASQESDISADADGRVDIGHLRGTRKVRIDMNDGRATLFGRHHPAKPYGMTLGKVAPFYENAITML